MKVEFTEKEINELKKAFTHIDDALYIISEDLETLGKESVRIGEWVDAVKDILERKLGKLEEVV